LTEPSYRGELVAIGYIDPRRHPEMLVCHWFNQNGTLIAGGLLNEDVFLDTFGRLVEYYWRLLQPAIDLLRRERGAHYYGKFEWLATRARAWRERHHGGGYPAALPRLPIVDPWAEIDRRDDVGVARA
jgi:hypothetical protein